MLGYKNQDIVVFDDLTEGSIELPLMLKLTDRYALPINIKGGEMTWNPKTIYITTNDNPLGWYGSADSWLRRIQVMHVREIENYSKVPLGNTGQGKIIYGKTKVVLSSDSD